MNIEPSSRRITKLFYFWGGILFTFAGIIGLIFPVIPGFIFLIPAAFCFAKSSAYFNRKIKNSKRFGRYFK